MIPLEFAADEAVEVPHEGAASVELVRPQLGGGLSLEVSLPSFFNHLANHGGRVVGKLDEVALVRRESEGLRPAPSNAVKGEPQNPQRPVGRGPTGGRGPAGGEPQPSHLGQREVWPLLGGGAEASPNLLAPLDNGRVFVVAHGSPFARRVSVRGRPPVLGAMDNAAIRCMASTPLLSIPVTAPP